MYSFVNYFREKSLYKRCHHKKTLDAVREDKHRIQGICLGILCDVLFLTGAIVSIALFSNPVAFFATAPLITLGCVVMVGNTANSICHQVKNFKNHLSQLSKKEQKALYTEMTKEINSSLLYRIEAKVLPDVVVLAKLHANKEDVKERKKIKQLKEMLKVGSRKPIDDNIANKDDRTIKTKEEKHTKQKSPNSKVPTDLSLGKNVVEEREKGSNTPRSL
ncbi:hypothetical protein [Wolbachia endosymbiont of Ctenocephalides felis wCfeJ]|uniref:hypothetical protein n=1 Tax=Wolbachia endosymbiont of Ctenocephalides felis wCfeJ TaxID=2732594 RepID=UPI001FE8444A|nr:hypothetical protein [Wolbachia endosymbiont of Ctenocephalides felis wCfeJ]WCR58060.1 MAG: hypothetical protein PG980_000532 [Wolbachia endosymbiont of Ctenocephalides felis wCfeJ]